ncbi:hypothetical protein [Bacillus sp. AK031]
MQQEIIKSIEDVRSVVDNSILLLRDLDSIFSGGNPLPVLGNAPRTESSKNINQSPNANGTFIPQFMF